MGTNPSSRVQSYYCTLYLVCMPIRDRSYSLPHSSRSFKKTDQSSLISLGNPQAYDALLFAHSVMYRCFLAFSTVPTYFVNA